MNVAPSRRKLACRPLSQNSELRPAGRRVDYFDAHLEDCATIVVVFYAKPNVSYAIGNEEHRGSGSGYHDHNWGHVPMRTLIHHWYWARAKTGP
jgi:hypothetical protein